MGNGAEDRRSDFNWFIISIENVCAWTKLLLPVIIRTGLIMALGTDCKYIHTVKSWLHI